MASLVEFNQQYYRWITWGVFACLCLLVVVISREALYQRWREWRRDQCIRNSSMASLKDVLLPDGMGGVSYYHYLALTHKAIFFFKTMPFKGIIFAADTIDYWTQVVGKRSFKFHNPLPQIEAECATLRMLDKHANIDGRVIFPRESSFPKGKPASVMFEDEVKALLQENMQGEPDRYQLHVWELLKSSIGQREQLDIDATLMASPKVLSSTQRLSVIGLLCASAIWLVWRLFTE